MCDHLAAAHAAATAAASEQPRLEAEGSAGLVDLDVGACWEGGIVYKSKK